MSETERDYAANYRKPPLHTRFKKGQSGNPPGSAREKPGGVAPLVNCDRPYRRLLLRPHPGESGSFGFRLFPRRRAYLDARGEGAEICNLEPHTRIVRARLATPGCDIAPDAPAERPLTPHSRIKRRFFSA